MDDPGLMGGVDRLRQGRHQRRGLPPGLRRAAHAGIETASLEQLERDERKAADLADVKDLNDVRMP